MSLGRVLLSAMGLTSLALSILFFYIYVAYSNGGLLSYEELTEIKGEVDWVRAYRYGTRFGLEGSSQSLVYPSKMKGQKLVAESLLNAGDSKVTVFADLTNPRSPIYTDRVFYNVYEVRVDDRIIRSYEDSAAAWMDNHRLSPLLAVILVAIGLYILWHARKTGQQKKELFQVSDTFEVEGRGVILTPGILPSTRDVKSGTMLLLLRPDGTAVTTTVIGVESSGSDPSGSHLPVLVDESVAKAEIPVGTRVYKA